MKNDIRVFTAGADGVPAVRNARRNKSGEWTVASTCPDCGREVYAFVKPDADTAFFGCSVCTATMLIGLRS